jgi:hypothetical protein
MNRDKTSSSSSISPPIIISSSSSSSSTSIITSFDQYLEGNLIKVKTGFYDGKLGYITGIFIINLLLYSISYFNYKYYILL